jgi:hypothetical protein
LVVVNLATWFLECTKKPFGICSVDKKNVSVRLKIGPGKFWIITVNQVDLKLENGSFEYKFLTNLAEKRSNQLYRFVFGLKN